MPGPLRAICDPSPSTRYEHAFPLAAFAPIRAIRYSSFAILGYWRSQQWSNSGAKRYRTDSQTLPWGGPYSSFAAQRPAWDMNLTSHVASGGYLFIFERFDGNQCAAMAGALLIGTSYDDGPDTTCVGFRC